MSNRDRYAIFPSRANLVATKVRLVSARKGLHMLKAKRDAIELKLRDMNSKIQSLEEGKCELMHEGLLHMARAKFHNSDLKPYRIAVPGRAATYCKVDTIRVVGVTLPSLSTVTDETNYYQMAGLARGGEETQAARLKFQEILDLLVSIASLKFSIATLEFNLRQTNTRCNAVEYVVIPRIEATRRYIEDALEEQEREDFYRLKCSKAKQDKHKKVQKQSLYGQNVIDMDDFMDENEVMQPEPEPEPPVEEPKQIIKEEPKEVLSEAPSQHWWQPFPSRHATKEIQTEGPYEPIKTEPKPTKTIKTQTDDFCLYMPAKPAADIPKHSQVVQTDVPAIEQIIRVENYAQTSKELKPMFSPDTDTTPKKPVTDPYISATTLPFKLSRPKRKPLTDEHMIQADVEQINGVSGAKSENTHYGDDSPNGQRRKRSKLPKETKEMQTDF